MRAEKEQFIDGEKEIREQVEKLLDKLASDTEGLSAKKSLGLSAAFKSKYHAENKSLNK